MENKNPKDPFSEMPRFLFQEEIGIRMEDLFPKRELTVLLDGKTLEKYSTVFYTKREYLTQLDKIKRRIVKEYQIDWSDRRLQPKIDDPTPRDKNLVTTAKVKIFKVWMFAHLLYFDVLTKDKYRDFRLSTARIFNRQIQRKGYKGYQTAKDIKRGYQRWLFNYLNPCLNKTGRPTPMIINWTIAWLRHDEIRLKHKQIANLLNAIVLFPSSFNERNIIMRHKRIDCQFYRKEFPLSLPAKDVYLKFFRYYSPPSL